MSDETLTAILIKVTAVAEDMATVKAQVESLVGNGQPGRIDKIENDVEDLQSSSNKQIGAASAFAFVVTGWELLKHFWKLN